MCSPLGDEAGLLSRKIFYYYSGIIVLCGVECYAKCMAMATISQQNVNIYYYLGRCRRHHHRRNRRRRCRRRHC